ncbi:MAG: hypothetical protein TEF_18795 [Rhizobiales bacterium NRL2]|jgi:hypothetical protein|nr:MAG: hypothetical protein TEF_18795 [Rhizobiales bacterium NRL2]
MGVPHQAPRYISEGGEYFYECLSRGELHLPTCGACGARIWYPKPVAPCHPGAEVEWRRASDFGRVYSFTTVYHSFLPDGDPSDLPYTVMLVEPEDAPGVRIPSLFVDADGGEPQIGIRVRLQPVRADGYYVAAYAPAV